MVDTDDPPAIDRLERGDEVRIYYVSDRSGNEVDRKGEFTHTTDSDDGLFYWVHTEQCETLKHQYVVLQNTETTDGDDAVAVYSVTVATELTYFDGYPPGPGSTVSGTFSIERTQFLGVVDRVFRDGWNINVQ